MKLRNVPPTNEFGLVLPPNAETLEYLNFLKPRNHKPDSVTRHHLYWPRNRYNKSPLAKGFREHRFNSVWILWRDHNDWHERFDGVPVPPKPVMERYLEEATILEELGVCIDAVQTIDIAIDTGETTRTNHAYERRGRRIENIHDVLYRARDLEVVSRDIAHIMFQQAEVLIEAA